MASRESIVTSISPDLTPLVEFSRQFLSGGKRFRALFCYWGWRSVCAPDSPLSPVVGAASALEIFHAAALVHDDIIDNSDTRRGAPSAHRLFDGLHARSGWAGDDTEFGRASAILLGDLMLGWSDELLDDALLEATDAAGARQARIEFNRMRTEVTAGQYLDILEERAWVTQPDSELLDRAHRVIVYKSAKYSVLAPLVIGAALAGATAEQLGSLREFGLPLGIAFQLRDDVLGVFGDAAVTGKPSGDDLREGKRTVLIALARDHGSAETRTLIDELLGNPDLTESQIVRLQSAIQASGAVDRVETLIADNVAEARRVLASAPLHADAVAELGALTDTVTRRSF
ncbi:polyprenyl synthetase family protein [Leifsonia kafniensis]|uniref:Polyprenyl synthetase family protein n=1 Tax=Leifsonia kafniensis TaxID=475957 RepID=A0ABP7K4Q2_9MICO